jgi:hypothetical protein
LPRFLYDIQYLIADRAGQPWGDPVGETDRGALRLDFDRRLMLRFRGSAITSDGGLLAYRELDDVLALTTTGGEILADARTGKNGRHQLVGLLRQSVFGRLAGYEDVNDAERLCRDPAMRWVVGGRAPMGQAASASQMGRFETEWLTRPENFAALADLPGQWIDTVHRRRSPRIVVLDMDSSESPTYGEQEGSAYKRSLRLHLLPPAVRVQPAWRSGAVRATARQCALGWRGVLEPVVSRYRGKGTRLYFRGDAAFANPDIYQFLEVEGMAYAIRLRANMVLQEEIGRPPHEVRRYDASFSYQAQSWKKPRRVVAKVEWHPGELYPRVGFIVTNLARPAERVVAFYNQRGTCEQWIKEGKAAIRWTRLSCRSFAANAVRLQLHALAYNLGNFMRTLAMPAAAEPWSLTSLREKLIKIGAKVVSHGRYVTFQMAEVAVPRQMSTTSCG